MDEESLAARELQRLAAHDAHVSGKLSLLRSAASATQGLCELADLYAQFPLQRLRSLMSASSSAARVANAASSLSEALESLLRTALEQSERAQFKQCALSFSKAFEMAPRAQTVPYRRITLALIHVALKQA